MLAERTVTRLAGSGPVTYVATMRDVDLDADLDVDLDLAARVAAHRARRPVSWSTVEAGRDLAGTLRGISGAVLLDSLGPWVAGHFGRSTSRGWADVDAEVQVDVDGLCAALMARPGDTVVVSEEVGMGVHPESALGRRFRDELGHLNQAVAEVANHTFLVAAGRTVRMSRPEDELDVKVGQEP
jgi:adenosyl cobinamide kinase/adenosyl cobinamide phosphate guanylyltransferase